MKVALLLTGGLRNYKDTFSSFEHYILKDLNPDVFFYGVENVEGVEKNITDFDNLYNPKEAIINNKQFYNDLTVDINYIKSSYFSFFNVSECNKLRLKYQEENNFEYDIVIRCRLDTFWFRYITKDELLLAENNLVIPKEWCFKEVHEKSLSDIFTITNNSLMNQYSNIFYNIDSYCKEVKFHPETLMGLHIYKNNIPYHLGVRHFEFFYPSESLENKHVPKPHKFIEYFDLESDILSYRTGYRKSFD